MCEREQRERDTFREREEEGPIDEVDADAHPNKVAVPRRRLCSEEAHRTAEDAALERRITYALITVLRRKPWACIPLRLGAAEPRADRGDDVQHGETVVANGVRVQLRREANFKVADVLRKQVARQLVRNALQRRCILHHARRVREALEVLEKVAELAVFEHGVLQTFLRF